MYLVLSASTRRKDRNCWVGKPDEFPAPLPAQFNTGNCFLAVLQFLCGFGELYARQSAVGCCAVSLLTVTPTPWRGGWALPGREGTFSRLCPLVWVGSRQQCSLQAVSGSSPGWRELGSLMARAVLAVLPSVIKGRGCCTSPLDP